MKQIVIFVSGGGSNAKAIYAYFKEKKQIHIAAIFSNKQNCAAIEWAKNHHIETEVFDKASWQSETYLQTIKKYKPDALILAGFLWLVPNYLIQAYSNSILNIHPSLLPNYGGKGMYGHFVHEAVIKNKEVESGLTIHLVNEEYDKGKILHQQKVEIAQNETPESLAQKILSQEHYWYPRVIEKYLLQEHL